MPLPTTIWAALEARLAADPDGPYLDFEGVGLTAREMADRAGRVAARLAALGVGRGDRVATLLENGPEQVVTFFAAVRLGAVQVPINTAYKGEFLRHVLADSGATVVVVQEDLADRIAELSGWESLALTRAVVVGAGSVLDGVLPWSGWDEVAATPAAQVASLAPVTLEPSDLACFIYTAGTTGPSKGCMLPHRYVVALGEQIARAWGRRADDVILTPLPLFHFNAISVCVVGTLLVGGHASIARRFSVSRFWPEVRRTGATMLSMLGSLAILVANAEDHPDQAGHRLRLCAAAPDAARHRPHLAGAVRLRDVQRWLRAHGGVAHLDAPGG